MIIKSSRISFTAALAFFGSACAPAAVGQVELDEERPRIVSLNPCLDAILVQIADPDQILALSHYSRDAASSSMALSVAEQFAFTGGTVEEVIAHQPDVVLASSFVAPATRAAFARFGVRVESFDSPNSVEASIAQVRELATLIGVEVAGELLVQEIAAATEVGSNEQAVSAVLWQSGGIVPGEKQLISELIRTAGFSSHSQAIGLEQADYLSLEQVLADPPDIVLVAGKSRAQLHPALAGADIHVVSFDPALFYCGGPSIPRAMNRLREIREGLK